jgi:CcmD family protein
MQFLEYMAAAYAVIWAAILIYFLVLGRKEKEIWEEIHELRSKLSEGENAPRPDA